MSSFEPNALTFDQGLERIHKALGDAGISRDRNEIVTSQDEAIRRASRELEVRNVPDGFKKWQLPVYLDRPSQLFISAGAPDTEVPEHSHDEGDGFRYIASGSVIYEGKELVAGDWMFIPKGRKYSMRVGPRGVTICYCYCCCCA